MTGDDLVIQVDGIQSQLLPRARVNVFHPSEFLSAFHPCHEMRLWISRSSYQVVHRAQSEPGLPIGRLDERGWIQRTLPHG